jgi:hypothetical protein
MCASRGPGTYTSCLAELPGRAAWATCAVRMYVRPRDAFWFVWLAEHTQSLESNPRCKGLDTIWAMESVSVAHLVDANSL